MSTLTSANLAKEMVKVREHSQDALLRYRMPLIVLSQIILVCVSYYSSFVLRLVSSFDAQAHSLFWQTLPLVIAVKLIIFYHFGLLRGWWRYVGMSDVLNITLATFLSSALLFTMIIFVVAMNGYPRSVVPIDMVLTIMLVSGARFGVRAYTCLLYTSYVLLQGMSHFGGYVGDTGTPLHPSRIEDATAYEAAGIPDPLLSWLKGQPNNVGTTCGSQGCNLNWQNMKWRGSCPTANGGVDNLCSLSSHIHIADQCVAKGLAGMTAAEGACF